MWQKISALPLAAYLAFTGLIKDIKKDERGLSGVVVTVLLILVAVLAVVMIWALLGAQIGEWWDQIISKSGEIQ